MPRQKPRRPYRTDPWTPYASGHFVKKFRGKTHSFRNDPAKSLEHYLNERDGLHVGRTPRRSDAVTTEYLVNAFCGYPGSAGRSG